MLLPPGNFTAIKDATVAGTVVSFVGAIVSIKEPRQSRGTDWVLDFTIQDDFTTGVIGASSTINCRFFKRLDQFPKFMQPGDIAIVRNFKLDRWRNRMDCVNERKMYNSGVLVYPAPSIPIPELSRAYQPGGNSRLPCHLSSDVQDTTYPETMAIINMKHAASGSSDQVRQHAATVSYAAQSTDRACLIKDLGLHTFYDVTAEVVNIYYTNHGTVELKVTDYTPNKSLFYYADPEQDSYAVTQHGWKGPYGYLVLSVILHESNAAWARLNVSIGDVVLLKNMHAKLSPSNKLEGAIHQDRRDRERVDIRKAINQSYISDITKRKHAYEKGRGNKSALQALQNEPKKSSAKTSAAKKEKKKQKQREEKETEQKQLEEKAKGWEAERSGINTNSKCSARSIKL